MDDYTSKLIERTKQRRQQLEGQNSTDRASQNEFQSSFGANKFPPKTVTCNQVAPRSRSAAPQPVASNQSTSNSASMCRATAVLVELRPTGVNVAKASSATKLPVGSESSTRKASDYSKPPVSISGGASEGNKETTDYPRTMAQRLEIWQKRISRDETQVTGDNASTNTNNPLPTNSRQPEPVPPVSASTSSAILPPKSPTPVSKRIAGAQQRLIEQTGATGMQGAARLSPKIAKPTPFVSTVFQTAAKNDPVENEDRGRPVSRVPLYGRPGISATSTFYAAGSASKTRPIAAALRADFEAKLNAISFEGDHNASTNVKRSASDRCEPEATTCPPGTANEEFIPPPKRVSLGRQSQSSSSLVVPFNPEMHTPRGFGSLSRSPSVSSRAGSSSQLATKPVADTDTDANSGTQDAATDSESVLSDSSDRLRLAAVRKFMNRRAQEVRSTDLNKQVGGEQHGASTASRDGTQTRIRFGQDAVRFLTDTETENDDRVESDDASMNGDRPESDLESASDSERLSARLETLNDTSDSVSRRRTRHGSEPAGATLATKPKYPDEIPKVKATTSSETNPSTVPKSHAISVTKLGGVLQLTETTGLNGSSLYNEITRELAKQNDLVSAMLADTDTGARRVGPVESVTKMDASDWSAVTSLSELDSEDDLRPSMNSTNLTQSRSSAAPAPVPVYANVNISKSAQQNYDSAASPLKPALQETSKRIPQLLPQPQVQLVHQTCDNTLQRDPDSASQISRSIRSQIEELLAVADQQDEIIKQASAALARCKQIQRRIATGQYGSVSRGTSSSADSYSSALPIQEFVEANRVLLIACQRRQACLAEVELFKTKTLHDASFDPLASRRGSLTIDGLRFGLKREFLERVGAFASEVHYVIVTLRLGSHVFVSQMINTEHDVDLRTRCIEVPNKFQLEIKPAFTMRLQVFCLTTAKELGIVPRSASNRTSTLTDLIPGACMSNKSKHCYDDSVTSSGSGSSRHANSTLHYVTPSKASRSNKEKKKKSVNEPPSWSMAASSFSEVGSLELTMRSVSNSSFTMERVPPLLCPLDGSVHMRLALQMESGVELRGFLTMFEDVAGIGSWHRRWFLLKNDLIRFWKYPDDEFRKEPLGVIRLDQCVNEAVQSVSREKCARPNTFELLILVRQVQPLTAPTTSVRTKPQMLVYSYLLSADTKEDRTVWCEKLNANVTFLRTWFADRMPKPFKHPTSQI